MHPNVIGLVLPENVIVPRLTLLLSNVIVPLEVQLLSSITTVSCGSGKFPIAVDPLEDVDHTVPVTADTADEPDAEM